MLIQLLRDNGISVDVLENKSREFQKRWIEAFTTNITKEEKREIHFGEYLWHIFSYQVLP